MDAQRVQRGLRGHLFGAAAARPLAFGVDARMRHGAGHQEGLGVWLAAGALDRVHRQRVPTGLQMFLQARLGILQRGRLWQGCDTWLEHRPEMRAHGVETAVEVQGAAQGLEGIREDRLAAEPAGLELTRAQQQKFAELHGLRDLGQRLLAHQARAQTRQVAFAGAGKFAVQPLREQQVEHGIAEELETLVVRAFGAAMRERDDEQRGIARFVAQPPGEQLRLGGRRAHGCRGIQLMTTVFLNCMVR